MMGYHIRFDAPNIIAITSGDLGATLDGQRIDTYRAIPVNAGERCLFNAAHRLPRVLCPFAGGLDIPVVMGSRSEYEARSAAIRTQAAKGRRHRLPRAQDRPQEPRHATPRPSSCRAQNMAAHHYSARGTMRSPSVASTFLSSVYTLTPEFDRMGCRLDGELIER